MKLERRVHWVNKDAKNAKIFFILKEQNIIVTAAPASRKYFEGRHVKKADHYQDYCFLEILKNNKSLRVLSVLRERSERAVNFFRCF